MGEALRELEELAKKYKKNGSRLGKRDCEAACDRLRALLLDIQYVDRACRLLTELPEECCRTVVDLWKEGDGDYRERLVRLLLDENVLRGDAEPYRKITFIAAFVSIDAQMAVRFLIDLCSRLTRNGTAPPPRPLATRFRKELLVTEKLFRISLAGFDFTASEISSIAVMVFSGLLDGAEYNPALTADVLYWLEQYSGGRIVLGANLTAQFEKTTSKWPVDVQRRLEAIGLVRTISWRIDGDEKKESALSTPNEQTAGGSGYGQPAGSETVQDGKSATIPCGESAKAASGTSLKPMIQRCIDLLSQFKKAAHDLEAENSWLRDRVRSLETDSLLTKQKIADAERQLSELNTLNADYQSTISNLQTQIAEIQRQNRALSNALVEEKDAHRQDVEKLKSRIDQECDQVLREFKNRLAEKLHPHYGRYLEGRRELSGQELLACLEFTLGKVFHELVNEGIGLA